MYGPSLLARYLTQPGPPDRNGRHWQYHSRSDRHSKVACWGVAFDLLLHSNLFRQHVASGKVVLGLNHSMADFATGRRKDLDLVIARGSGVVNMKAPTFDSLVERYGIPLDDTERSALADLPDLRSGPVGAVLVAVEAKACMTAHVKSLPRLYDELNSSHLCVHGASKQALAIGYSQVNASERFISPVINSRWAEGTDPEVSRHKPPGDVQRVLDFVNDGSPVRLVEGPPGAAPGGRFNYADMIVRMANEYDWRFANT